jgi:hypothetical protein
VDREEALKLLTGGPEGVAKWNAWREENAKRATPEPLPDLTKAVLTEVDLTKANLEKVNLQGAKLFRTNLSDANLSDANLSGANLFAANLQRADLPGTNLSGANLAMVNLQDAVLSDANLFEARLLRANLQGAGLITTDLTGAKLFRANLAGALLFKSQLNRADLDGIDGRFTDFSNTEFESASFWRRMWGKVVRFFTWRTVRAVGALQVLTKASYVMLALVPILAGLWLGVRSWAAPAGLTAHMPSAWAVGFFAALFVVLGHFVYQVWCPELVKEQTPDKFAEAQLAGFSADGHDKNDRLTRATNALKELAEHASPRCHANLVRRHGRVVWIPSNLEFFEIPPDTPAENKDGNPPRRVVSAGPGLMRVAIEEGARAEYELQALRNRGTAVISFAFYAIAGVLIAWLVGSQSWSVMKAVGWV